MDGKVLSTQGKELRTIELADDVFGREVSEGAIYHAIRNELANARVGTASTKGRSEVNGSHRKPWRQKGTGRARAGTFQSPVRVGGGIAFGPKPRDYSYAIPRKMKQAAMRSLLSLHAQRESLVIVEDFAVESGKTKEFAKIVGPLVDEAKTVFVVDEDAGMLRRAGRNLPWVQFLSYRQLRAHELFYGAKLLMTETAAKKLNEFYGAK